MSTCFTPYSDKASTMALINKGKVGVVAASPAVSLTKLSKYHEQTYQNIIFRPFLNWIFWWNPNFTRARHLF